MNREQLQRARTGAGFLAALDQSGGSTPKALSLYGVSSDAWSSEAEMFDIMHAMRSRMMTSPVFDGSRILGAILFEMTMDREVDGVPSAQFLWERKSIIPFLKVDKGLEDEVDGVQVMKPMPDLNALLDRAIDAGIFGTKMRSVIKHADTGGIQRVVEQQVRVGLDICARGLVPIIEPEVDIHATDKADAEDILHRALLDALAEVNPDAPVMLKLTIPNVDNLYSDLVAHPAVVRVVALSGGYERADANERLSRNMGMIASFSRTLTEGLSVAQSDEEFNSVLDASIEGIFQASIT